MSSENGSSSVQPHSQTQPEPDPEPDQPLQLPISSSKSNSIGTTSPFEQADIDASLQRRRHSSFSAFFRSYAQPGKKTAGAAEAVIVEEESDVEPEDEEQIERLKNEYEEYAKKHKDGVKLVSDWNVLDEEAPEIDPDQLGEDVSPEFVWDIMFENQRGIYLLGTGYFSSAGLLPHDPSPFTKPPRSLDAASSLSEPGKQSQHWSSLPGDRHLRNNNCNNNDEGNVTDPPGSRDTAGRAERDGSDGQAEGSNGRSTSKAKAPAQTSQRPNRRITLAHDYDTPAIRRAMQPSSYTGHTLDTFEPPIPDWAYITPWMVNMRVGTDESGWRYNSWFKRKGWSSHAGFAGWGGWVRRREWVRLRYIGPQTRLGAGAGAEQGTEGMDLEKREKVERVPKDLEAVLTSEAAGENVQSIVRAMAKLSLDRERLETWQSWLGKAENNKQSETWRRLEALAEDEDAVSDLCLDAARLRFSYPAALANIAEL